MHINKSHRSYYYNLIIHFLLFDKKTKVNSKIQSMYIFLNANREESLKSVFKEMSYMLSNIQVL